MGFSLPLAALLVGLLASSTPSLAAAQADRSNRPFIGVWKLNPERSHMPAPSNGLTVYRQYEAHAHGWMYHTVITIAPRRTDFLFTAARYDGKQYPVYDARDLGDFISGGVKTRRTVAFTRINASKFLWTDRIDGKVVAGGACMVSAHGDTLTITNQPPGRKTMTEQVYDRVSAPSALPRQQVPSR